MAMSPNTGIARRRANVRRAIIATLVVACLALFTGYFREADTGPLHGVQSSTAGVMAPVQEVASKAVQPFRDGWNYMTSWRDARDRAARLERELESARAALAANVVDRQELTDLKQQVGGIGDEVSEYRPLRASIYTRSVTAWDRTAGINMGRNDGVMKNSPVVVGSERGTALLGIVTRVRGSSSDVAFITDGRTQVGARVPQGGNYEGLVQAITPGQLRLTMIPREAPVEDGQMVVTSGFVGRGGGLPSIYPKGLPIGIITGHGSRPSDSQATVQVTPLADPSGVSYVTVLIPEGPQALRRAAG